ncbi:MAG TPA: histidine phosphatase family protein [Pyrinomonadaceae bacterium]
MSVLLTGLFLIGFAGGDCFGQKREITVLIFRHADKEPETEGDESEPDVSLDGQMRAVRLVKALEKYKPARIFSTGHARTVQTVTPLSRIKNLPIESYDGDLKTLAERILASDDRRTIAVVGINATNFELVNLFLKEKKYTMPDESDYGKIWILRIKDGKVKDKVIDY